MSTLLELFWCAALLHVLYKWQIFFFCEELRLQAMNSVRRRASLHRAMPMFQKRTAKTALPKL